jgi:alkaline phosphatase D
MEQLLPNLFLLLTDGRSFKESRGQALLAPAQCVAIETALNAAPPKSTHLVASGVVFEARHGECWLDCKTEHAWLMRMAQQHNEATSSGAALRTTVVLGSLQQNWSLLDISDRKVRIDIFKFGAKNYSGEIDRITWA